MVRIGRNLDFFFWKRGPKKVCIGQQKVAYLTTCPEYKHGTFIPAGKLGNLKVVKLWKKVWFYLIFGPILVGFCLEMRSDLGPNFEM